MTAHQITRIAPSKYRRELVSLRTVLVATLQLSDRSGRHQSLAGCGKTRESRFLTAKAIRNDKTIKSLAAPVNLYLPKFPNRVFPQPVSADDDKVRIFAESDDTTSCTAHFWVLAGRLQQTFERSQCPLRGAHLRPQGFGASLPECLPFRVIG